MNLVKIMNNSFYWRFFQVHQDLQLNIKMIDQNFHRIRHTHLLQERMQMYEALSSLSSNEQQTIYRLLEIPQNDKKRKVKAANTIWENDDMVEASVRTIIGLHFSDNSSSFFESTSNYPTTTVPFNSSKTCTSKSTKKGRKRLHINKQQLDFSNSSDFVHTVFQPRLDVRIRKNLHEAARGCFGKIIVSQNISKCRVVSDIQLHWYDAVASNDIRNNSVGH